MGGVRRFTAAAVLLTVAMTGCKTVHLPFTGDDDGPAVTAGDQNASHSILAVGDSFSSGEGASAKDGWLPGTNTKKNRCHRSSETYSYQLQRRLGDDWSLTLRACSGAKLKNLGAHLDGAYADARQGEEPLQLDIGDSKYDLVTMTMGGNDLDFAAIISECVTKGWVNRVVNSTAGRLVKINQCEQHYATIVDRQLAVLEPALPKAYAALKSHVKDDGQVVVLGYPLFFPDQPPGSCSTGAATSFGRSDMLWLNSVARRADAAIERAATAAGVSYLDVHNLFRTGEKDHGVCQDANRGDGARWVNGSSTRPRSPARTTANAASTRRSPATDRKPPCSVHASTTRNGAAPPRRSTTPWPTSCHPPMTSSCPAKATTARNHAATKPRS
jgi:hypothetical protein